MWFPELKSEIKIGREITKNIYYFNENPVLDCNQYIIIDEATKDLALFDAGNGISLTGLIEGMNKLNLNYQNITKIFITHEHVDHVIGLYPLLKILKNKPFEIFGYGETAKVLKEGDVNKIFPTGLGITPDKFGLEVVPLKITQLQGNEIIKISSDYSFKIYYTPGHSQGSICFYEPNNKILIPGDLVFIDGFFGRYDFPGGSLKILTQSIGTINKLDVHYLLPGHMGTSNQGNIDIARSYKMIQSINQFF